MWREKARVVLLLSISSSTMATSTTLARGNGVVGDRFLGTNLARDRALVPVVSGIVRNFSCSGLSTVTVSTNPNSFANIHVNITAIGKLTFIGGAPYVPISALRTTTCGFTGRGTIVYTIVSTEHVRFCGTLFGTRGNGVVHLYRSETVNLGRLLPRVSGCSEIVTINSNTRLLYGGTKLSGLRYPPKSTFCRATINITTTTRGGRAVGPTTLVPICLELDRTRERLGLGGWTITLVCQLYQGPWWQLLLPYYKVVCLYD